ncbi:MAG: hypothetical protein A2Z34_03825 [Planctomycetes bacterium RBG_16_59_8]|nr:MAG: hypothetical protein A2Z34_03825 [Planctomycetes bacterium RBG_16_59_8]
MRILVDESVCRTLTTVLRQRGDDVTAISELGTPGIPDEQVFTLAERQQAVLITRDYHFTNPLRFPSARVGAVIYIRHGNLTSEEESALVVHFLDTHPLDAYRGTLVTLAKSSTRVR